MNSPNGPSFSRTSLRIRPSMTISDHRGTSTSTVAQCANSSGSPKSRPGARTFSIPAGGSVNAPKETSGCTPMQTAASRDSPFSSARRKYSNMRRREWRLTPSLRGPLSCIRWKPTVLMPDCGSRATTSPAVT